MNRKFLFLLFGLLCAINVWADDISAVNNDNISLATIGDDINHHDCLDTQSNTLTTPNYITLTAMQDNTEIGLVVFGDPNISTLQYSIDGEYWWSITGSVPSFRTFRKGEYIKFRSLNQVSFDGYYVYFTCSAGAFKASGNVNTMIDYTDSDNLVCEEYSFTKLFYECIGLVDISDLILPATTLKKSCYSHMFYGCTGLTSVPSDLLPATTLGDYCYYEMFYGCTGLTDIPSNLLPAITLVEGCYESMFRGCTGLTTIPLGLVPSTALAEYCYFAMFSDCTGLASIPSDLLPATTLVASCYRGMFSGCTGLTSIPSDFLPATTLANNCYGGMFSGCTGLTSIPSDLLPATTLASECYDGMFRNCTGLTSVPPRLLQSPALAYGCYRLMFFGCTSLNNIPSGFLPSTTLSSSCYSSMFRNCSNLVNVAFDLLPATTLNDDCYMGMFENCTSLTSTPELPSTNLVTQCYHEMFKNCTSLSSVTIHATNWISYNAENWLSGVSSTGNMYNLGGANLPVGANGIPAGWTEYGPRIKTITAVSNNENYGTISGAGSYIVNETCTLTATPNEHYTFISWTENDEVVSTDAEYSFTVNADRNLVAKFVADDVDYLTLTATASNTTIGIGVVNSPNISTLEYSYDGISWNSVTGTTTFNTLQNGEFIKFRSENQVSSGYSNYIIFTGSTGSYSASGNINTLINYTDVDNIILEEYAFVHLFKFCTLLNDVSNLLLPAMTLASGCYESMFLGCTSLVEAPELPATTLASYCYRSMFNGCTSLVEAPELPAMTLAEYCYSSMFNGCTSLVEAPELLAMTLANECYYNMFWNCTSLVEAPELPATTLASCCYSGMFNGCTSLVEAPELPATTLASYCYFSMFSGCSSLNSVTTYATTWNSDYAYDWLSGVSATGNFYNLGGADISIGTSGIPEGWTEYKPYTFTGSGSWILPSNWTAPGGSTPTTMPDLTNEDVIIDGIAYIPDGTSSTVKSLTINASKVLEINDGASLTVSGTINNNDDVNSLIINDGGQIFQANENIQATFRKSIVNPADWEGTQKDGWQFISSPITDAAVVDFIPETGGYDLFIWDNQNTDDDDNEIPWVNYKAHVGESGDFSDYFDGDFYQGAGYLASYQSVTTADFSGSLNGENSFAFEIDYNKYWPWKLFLLGNPFTFDIDWADFSKTNVTDGFVTLNPQTGAYTYQNSGTIKVGEGFVVQTTKKNPVLEYDANSKSERNNIKSINVTVSNSKGYDNTIISFDGSEDGGFPKLDNFNDDIASVFTVKDNVKYGINSYNSDTQSIPLYFDAKEIGYYTIKMQPIGDFSYIHLIDRQTGNDIDMLFEGEYRFAAMSGEDQNRFIIKLSDDNDDDNDNCFAYQSGKTLYINEVGTIQIVDMTGRIVINEKLSGNSVDISGLRNAAYIVRLVNENEVKTQKIVVL